MPWTCPNAACGQIVEHDSDVVCPTCQTEKTAWTMGRQTRRLVISKAKKLEARRGRRVEPAPGALYPHAGVAWRSTTTAAVVPVHHVKELMKRGELPDPDHVLCVRLYPAPGGKTTAVRLTPMFELRHVDDVVLEFDVAPEEAGDAGWFALHVLCVNGAGAGELHLPPLHILDVSDEPGSGRSHAPTVDVSAPRMKPLTITLEPVVVPQLTVLEVKVHDEAYRPVADAPYVLTDSKGKAVTGRTDDQGRLEQFVEPGDFRLEVTRPGRPPLRMKVSAGELEGQDEWVQQAVSNLGFTGRSDAERLYAFQTAHDLPRSGKVDGPSRDAVQQILDGAGPSLRERLGKS